MSIIDSLSDPAAWERFYEYKTSLVFPEAERKKLRSFIDDEAYLPVCAKIARGERFALPEKSVISKLSTGKKRTVYTYPPAENTVLKLLTHLLLRRYDGLFAPGLYSFRPGRSAKDAVEYLLKTPFLPQKYAYKADISDYFNSIPIPRLLPILKGAVGADGPLYAFLEGLLTEPEVLENGAPKAERKGIMAGTPTAAFLANLYLAELDARFYSLGVPYCRYSDDVIILADSEEQSRANAELLRAYAAEAGLAINPKKECFSTPEEGFAFLGFTLRNGEVDIAPASVKKLKAKMRRKARALARWARRQGVEGEKAAKAFIRIFNRKLFENPAKDELTWTYWFFPVITTPKSLYEIDRYAQDRLRALISGTETKARFNVRYESLKALGYKSLVHAYYDYSEDERARRSRPHPPARSAGLPRP